MQYTQDIQYNSLVYPGKVAAPAPTTPPANAAPPNRRGLASNTDEDCCGGPPGLRPGPPRPGGPRPPRPGGPRRGGGGLRPELLFPKKNLLSWAWALAPGLRPGPPRPGGP